ncbi:ABC transporter ATP-binding protein [Exiguobacterium sp. SL-10]|jgi:ABC-2 type transport system ATP-binding protein|uniref:ABC transporter ATP-binding protein n=1 Tax=Exiguobacterium sp. SL-10 TaxID=2510962 RepID=UPI00103F0ECC|nr:ABC transporter ATP-binding protein [Exiguobacterium sp. SL-10]TCI28787.1 ABC transporter ATP-binding protein [Exiguobacterium sp. SL-10]
MLHVDQLNGGYIGKQVLHDISFEVKKGELVGLIGLNGAGKSTTIKHILGLLDPISGSVEVDSETLTSSENNYRKKISYIPETPILYDTLTLREHLTLIGKAYDIEASDLTSRTERLARDMRMEKQLDWFPSVFSKGMRQKAMILCALVTKTPLLIVDEPFVGLDPLAIRQLLRLFDEYKEDCAILMSTHILETAERHCDRFVFLHQGSVIATGTAAQLRETYGLLPDATLDDIYVEAIDAEERKQ